MPEIPLSIFLLLAFVIAGCFWLAHRSVEIPKRIQWERAEPIDLAAERDAFVAARDRAEERRAA